MSEIRVNFVGVDQRLAIGAAQRAEQAAGEAGAASSIAAGALAALLTGTIYPDTAAGLAATEEGGYFVVAGDGTDTYAILYQEVSGSAELIARFPSLTALESFLADLSSTDPGKGAGLVRTESGETVEERFVPFNTAKTLGGSPNTSPGVNDNVLVGGSGTFSSAPIAERTSWDALSTDPSTGDNSLGLSGHHIVDEANSAQIIGGRAGYYSAVGSAASDVSLNGYGSLTLTYGGDNYNNHLAGFNLSMHSDLIQGTGADEVTLKGSHGLALGGSFHQVAGDHSASISGQMKQVFALQSIALGGRNIKIGSLENVDAVRRSGSLGGYMNEIASGFQVALIGGQSNTWTAGNNGAIIGGDNNEVNNVERGAIIASQLSKVTADRNIVLASTYAVGDVVNAITRSIGLDTTPGDSQTHHIEVRRSSVGPNLYPSVTGGSGVELFTPPPNTRGVVRLLLTVQKKQTTGNEGAEYEIKFAYSNIGGTLSILGQDLTVIYEDDELWNCQAVLTGSNTRIAVVVQTNGDTGTFLVTGTGEIVVQTVTP